MYADNVSFCELFSLFIIPASHTSKKYGEFPSYITEHAANSNSLPENYVNTGGSVSEDDSHSIQEKLRPYPDNIEPTRPPATTRRRIAGK